MENIKIVQYEEKYKHSYCLFKKEFINIEWTDKLFIEYKKNFHLNKDNFLFLLLDKEIVIGALFTQIKNNQIYIHEIEISINYQNRGFGNKLLEFLKLRYKNFDIELSVEKDNTQAINFYLKNGFAIVSQRGKCHILRTNLDKKHFT